jgi:hypothetical protein
MQKTETRSLFPILYKNQFKMDQRPECNTWNFAMTIRKHMGDISRYKHRQQLSEWDFNNSGNNSKNWQIELHQIQIFCIAKKTVTWGRYSLWNLCQLFIQQVVIPRIYN